LIQTRRKDKKRITGDPISYRSYNIFQQNRRLGPVKSFMKIAPAALGEFGISVSTRSAALSA